jgi:hemerythrin
MQWSSEFEVGVSVIDVQHWHLFSLIQRVNRHESHSDPREIHDIVFQLGRLARCHFDCEEWLMDRHDYPDSDRHCAEHGKLVLEIKDYLNRHPFTPRQLAIVLNNWLLSHTLLEDRPLALYLLGKHNQGEDIALSTSLADAFFAVATGSGIRKTHNGLPSVLHFGESPDTQLDAEDPEPQKQSFR